MRAALLGAVVLSLLVWWAKAPPRDKEEEEEEEEDTALGVHVYLYCEVDHAWVEDVRKLLSRAYKPWSVDVNVVLGCTRPEDAHHEHASVPRDLGSNVSVELERSLRDEPYKKRWRKLLKKYGSIEEDAIVVLLSPGVGTVYGWDKVLRTAPRLPITVPLPHHETGIATFPTLGETTSLRGESIAVQNPDRGLYVTAVCMCEEFVAGKRSFMQTWLGGQQTQWMVPAFDFLERAAKAPAWRNADGNDETPSTHAQKLGLSGLEDEVEFGLKFGSSKAARLSLKFIKREKR